MFICRYFRMDNPYFNDEYMIGSGGDFKTSAQFELPSGVPEEGKYWNLPQSQKKKVFPKKRTLSNSKSKVKGVDVRGKTPALIANELFTGMSEEYIAIEGLKSTYKCIITINGDPYEATSSSKKSAKHEACLVAISRLRPDIKQLIETNEGSTPLVKMELTYKDEPKKRKMNNPLDESSSMRELFTALTQSRNIQHTFDITDVTDASSDIKERTKITSLTFPDIGKLFTHTDPSPSIGRDIVIRRALKEVLNVSEEDILRVHRRAFMKKTEKMNSVQGLQYICIIAMYKLNPIELEDSIDEKTHMYSAHINVTDFDGNSHIIKGPKCKSKATAKERATCLALSEIFKIDEGCAEGLNNDECVSPVQKLYIVGTRQKPIMRPSFIDLGCESNGNVSIFKSQCCIGDKSLIGTGRSKKEAKNDSADRALKLIFHMDVKWKKELIDKEKEDEIDYSLFNTTCHFVLDQYKKMCSFYKLQPSSHFASFVLLNDHNERKLISIGSSPQNITSSSKIESSKGKVLIHHDSIIYARRGFIRYLITELSKAMRNEESCMELGEDGLYHVKNNLRLAIVTSQPINIRNSAIESQTKRLTIHTESNMMELIGEDGGNNDNTVHSVADKIYKWCHLGVQGCLLTRLIHPIIPSFILTCSSSPLSYISYNHSLTSRTCTPPFPIHIHSSNISIDVSLSSPHIWSRGDSKLEEICHLSGKVKEGNESTCCKYQLYKELTSILPSVNGLSYYEAKKSATSYHTSKNILYGELEKGGWGRWKCKPITVDDFVITQ